MQNVFLSIVNQTQIIIMIQCICTMRIFYTKYQFQCHTNTNKQNTMHSELLGIKFRLCKSFKNKNRHNSMKLISHPKFHINSYLIIFTIYNHTNELSIFFCYSFQSNLISHTNHLRIIFIEFPIGSIISKRFI